jgi:hypothetical protein
MGETQITMLRNATIQRNAVLQTRVAYNRAMDLLQDTLDKHDRSIRCTRPYGTKKPCAICTLQNAMAYVSSTMCDFEPF